MEVICSYPFNTMFALDIGGLYDIHMSGVGCVGKVELLDYSFKKITNYPYGRSSPLYHIVYKLHISIEIKEIDELYLGKYIQFIGMSSIGNDLFIAT